MNKKFHYYYFFINGFLSNYYQRFNSTHIERLNFSYLGFPQEYNFIKISYIKIYRVLVKIF